MKKLLIVGDDENVISKLKKLFMQKNNFRLTIAQNLEELENSLSLNKFFLVISSVDLIGVDSDKIKKLLNEYKVPTIYFSDKKNQEVLDSIDDIRIIEHITNESEYCIEKAEMLSELILFMDERKVLYVKNESDSDVYIEKLLHSLLLDIEVVYGINEASDKLKYDKDISLLILDSASSETIDLTKNLRKEKTYSNLPIIVFSDSIDIELKSSLYKNDINDFIIKPVLSSELKRKIINIFSAIKNLEDINNYNKIFDENIIVSVTNKSGVIKSVSKAFCEISGYTKKELIGKNHNLVKHPNMPKSIYKELWDTISNGRTWKGEIKNLRKDGTFYWVSAVIEPIFDRKGNIDGYQAVRQDITDKKRIYQLSITDALTNIYNRRYFDEIGQEVLNKTVRNNKYFAFLLLDIDNFKKYNDTYGHQEGDIVLKSVANDLKSAFKRYDDLIFRLGGEEFGVLLSASSQEDITRLTNQAKDNLLKLKIEHTGNEPVGVVSASFGLVIIPVGNKINTYNLDEIYKKADDYLYKAKANGRNRIEQIVI